MWALCLKRDQKVATFWQKIATCKKQPHWRNMSQFSALIKCISNAIALYINKQVSQLNRSKFDLTFEFCCLSSQICFFFICHFFWFSKASKQILALSWWGSGGLDQLLRHTGARWVLIRQLIFKQLMATQLFSCRKQWSLSWLSSVQKLPHRAEKKSKIRHFFYFVRFPF